MIQRTSRLAALLLLVHLPLAAQKGSAPGAGARPPGGIASAFQQEAGVLGTQYPQPNHVVVEDTVVHQDTQGGVDQRLLDLAAGPDGGFAAVWQDQRDGNLGLYLGLLDALGAARGPEVPVNPPLTARQFSPAVALGPNARGAVAWFATSVGKQGVMLRFFDGPRGFAGVPIPVGQAAGREVDGGPGRGAQGRGSAASRGEEGVSHVPDLVVNPSGKGGAAVWLEGGEVWTRAFFDARNAEPSALQLNPAGPPAAGEVLSACDAKGRMLAVWRDGERKLHGALRVLPEPKAASKPSAPVALGEGDPVRVHADPSGGWWVLVRVPKALVLRHLDEQGRVDRQDLAPAALQGALLPEAADFAPYLQSGVVVCVQRPASSGATSSRIELHFVLADGKPLFQQPLIVLKSDREVHNARVASHGEALCVAWTDDRNGNEDVFARFLSPTKLDGEEQRWNSDVASSSQTNPDVDSFDGSSAWVVWQDERESSSRARIFARKVARDGSFAGDEVALSSPQAPSCWFPAVVQGEDGRAFATWSEERSDGWALVGQGFGPDGALLGPPVELEAAGGAGLGWASALVALPQKRGFVAVWVRDDVGPMLQRIAPSGKAEGAAIPLGGAESKNARNPSACLLDDGRVLAAWDVKPGRDKPSLRARVLGPDLKPQVELLEFEASPQGGDWDPSVCAGPEGGFLLAWCGNDGPPRDVFARRFDRQGKPAGPPLAISVKNNEQDFADLLRLPDASFAIAWEDDISWRDHTQLRRIAADGRSLGAPMTLNQRPSNYVDDRTAPRLARLGDGLIAVWDDRRRSLGHDVYLRVLGPQFDRKLPEPVVVGPEQR